MYAWDGPEDSDEEVQEMVKYKTQYEINQENENAFNSIEEIKAHLEIKIKR